MIKYYFFIIFIFLFKRIKTGGGASTETEHKPKNFTGIDCYNNTKPETEEDCFPNFDIENSCCFAVIKLNKDKNITSCIKIKNEYDFIGTKLKKLEYNGTFYNASVVCESDAHAQKNCGVWTPKNIEDCRLDGSKDTSCCVYNDYYNTKTCLLSGKKIAKTTSYYFQNSALQCNSNFNTVSLLSLLLIILLMN